MASPSGLDELPRLSTSFVTVREVVETDAPVLHELLSDSAVTIHLSAPPPSVDAFVGFIRWARAQRAARHSVTFGIVPHGLDAAVGIVQLRALDPTWTVAEWGFALGAAFWGTGVFAEAAHLVVAFAFDHLQIERLEARAASGNGRANGALHKIGAAAEVTLMRSFRRSDGTYGEQLLWSLRAQDWRQTPLFAPPRFDPATVKARIAEAVQHVRADVEHHRAAGPSRSEVPLYPFVVLPAIKRD